MSHWYIEGIGHEFGLIEPMYMMLDNGNGFECYAEDYVPLFPEGSTCDLTVGIDENSPVEMMINVYPNPSKGKITLSFNSDYEKNINLKIVGILGETLVDTPWKLNKGLNEMKLDLSSAETGIFTAILQNGTFFIQKKFMLVN